MLAQRFGDEQFPLPRKRRVKLTYLLHRHAEGRAEGYLKKAAGPYDPNTKYKGPEQIALKNGYVRALRNEKYEGFVAGDKIEQAQRYFEQWYGDATLEWLERFHYRKTDDLELLATVDMAMVDLTADGGPVDVTSVKRVISAHPEWLPPSCRASCSRTSASPPPSPSARRCSAADRPTTPGGAAHAPDRANPNAPRRTASSPCSATSWATATSATGPTATATATSRKACSRPG